MKLRYKISATLLAVFVATLAWLGWFVSHDNDCLPVPEPAEGDASMAAIRHGCFGGPEVLELARVPRPVAADDEILVKGDSVFLGYFKDPQATAETLTDGWLHTGDLGAIDEDGFVTITGRKKDIIITAGGKNIAPQYIESKLRLSAYIHDAIVIGEGRKFVSALIILDEDNLVEWAQLERVQFGTYAELARTDKVRQLIDGEVQQVNDTLTHVEAIKQFRILERRLDQDEGELTPTLKVRRQAIENKYGDLIDEMYGSR